MRVVMLTGYKGSGKDTIADALAAHLEEKGRRVLIDRFGLPLRTVLERATALPYDRARKVQVEEGISGETFLMALEVGLRQLHPDFLAWSLAERIRNRVGAPDLDDTWVVVPDLRFPEDEAVLRRAFPLVAVVRVLNPSVSFDGEDPTERFIDRIVPDLVVRNVPGETDPLDLARYVFEILEQRLVPEHGEDEMEAAPDSA